MLGYLKNDLDYLPWKTVEIHLDNVISVLEYRRSFKPISVIHFILKTNKQTILSIKIMS
jgi:hypothetical protein